jgi:hypothetical protein
VRLFSLAPSPHWSPLFRGASARTRTRRIRSDRGKSACGVHLPELEQKRPPDRAPGPPRALSQTPARPPLAIPTVPQKTAPPKTAPALPRGPTQPVARSQPRRRCPRRRSNFDNSRLTAIAPRAPISSPGWGRRRGSRHERAIPPTRSRLPVAGAFLFISLMLCSIAFLSDPAATAVGEITLGPRNKGRVAKFLIQTGA